MKRFAPSLFMTVLFISSCVSTNGPGGSEITNGKIAALDGSMAAGITVAAYPADFIKGKNSDSVIVRTVTDSTGAFELPIDTGFYNIFIIDTLSNSGHFLRDIGPKTDCGTLRLDSLGSIDGNIRVDSAQKIPRLIIYGKGTPLRLDIASNEGSFRFDGVPPGAYSLTVAVPPKVGCIPGIDCGVPGVGGKSGFGNVMVVSGATTVVDTLMNVADIGELP